MYKNKFTCKDVPEIARGHDTQAASIAIQARAVQVPRALWLVPASSVNLSPPHTNKEKKGIGCKDKLLFHIFIWSLGLGTKHPP